MQFALMRLFAKMESIPIGLELVLISFELKCYIILIKMILFKFDTSILHSNDRPGLNIKSKWKSSLKFAELSVELLSCVWDTLVNVHMCIWGFERVLYFYLTWDSTHWMREPDSNSKTKKTEWIFNWTNLNGDYLRVQLNQKHSFKCDDDRATKLAMTHGTRRTAHSITNTIVQFEFTIHVNVSQTILNANTLGCSLVCFIK